MKSRPLLSISVRLIPASVALALSGTVFAQKAEPAATAPRPHAADAQAGEVKTPAKTKAPVIPDVAVVDQDNRKLHFYRDLVEGKTVAINFIFTTCTTICPPLTANFAKIQKIMQDRGDKNLRLISVTVDPENDTPERLKKYAQLFHAQPGWTFVTGSRADLERIWKAFDIYMSSKQDHPPIVAVGNDGAGVWNYASGLTSAAKIVAVIDATMHGQDNAKAAGVGAQGQTNAPQ